MKHLDFPNCVFAPLKREKNECLVIDLCMQRRGEDDFSICENCDCFRYIVAIWVCCVEDLWVISAGVKEHNPWKIWWAFSCAIFFLTMIVFLFSN